MKAKKTVVFTVDKNDFSIDYWEHVMQQLELPRDTTSITGRFTLGMFSTDKERAFAISLLVSPLVRQNVTSDSLLLRLNCF